MDKKKYGFIADTTAEARAIGSSYSQAGAHFMRFAVCDWNHPLNGKGKTGAEARRAYMDSQPVEVQKMYIHTRTIGTPWVEIQFTAHSFHRMPLAMQNALKDTQGRFKADTNGITALKFALANGFAQVVAKHSDYVKDLYSFWLKTLKPDKTGKMHGNFGYAFEIFRHGAANYSDSKIDGGKEQNKASFALYRTEQRDKYARGQTDGVSTANGER